METEPHVPEVQAYARKDESGGVRQPQTAREHRDQGGHEQKEAKLSEIRLHLLYRSYSPTVTHTNIDGAIYLIHGIGNEMPDAPEPPGSAPRTRRSQDF